MAYCAILPIASECLRNLFPLSFAVHGMYPATLQLLSIAHVANNANQCRRPTSGYTWQN